MPQTKIQGKFYPLTESIAEALRKAKLSAAEWRIWSYLIVLNPFGDRYEEFDYLSVMSVCDCSKTTMWRAFTKFQEFNIFDFQSRGICVRTLTGTSQLRKPETEPDPPKNDSIPSPKPKPKPKTTTSDHPKTIEPPILRKKPSESPQPPEISDLEEINEANHPSSSTNNYPEISDPWDDEPISELKSEVQNCNNDFKNEISVSKMKSEVQNCNNEGLKPLSDIASLSPQTLQINLDPPVQPDGEGEDLNSQYEEFSPSEQVKPNDSTLTQNEQVESKKSKVQNEQIKANETTLDTREEKDVPRAVTQNTTEIIREAKETLHKKVHKSELPQDLVNWMEELTIPLDEKVLKAIANHHISQAYGACRHVEETWETIDNPKSIFLYQIPKQKIEKLGPQLPEIGPKMREENAAIEKEMASDEYKAKSKEMFAKFRERFGKGGRKS